MSQFLVTDFYDQKKGPIGLCQNIAKRGEDVNLVDEDQIPTKNSFHKKSVWDLHLRSADFFSLVTGWRKTDSHAIRLSWNGA